MFHIYVGCNSSGISGDQLEERELWPSNIKARNSAEKTSEISFQLNIVKGLKFHIPGEGKSLVGDAIRAFPSELFCLVIREVQTVSHFRDLFYQI